MQNSLITNQYLDIAPEVAQALADHRPVVALESTIISHGMPYPQNVETALQVEDRIRANGAVPATIAVINGRMKAGLSHDEIETLGREGHRVAKVSRRDLPFVIASGKNGATTVASTMIIAELAGISVFATGGIGGVHRGAQQTFDISADLQELAQTNVAVVCAGAKSILDLGLTAEYLETHGVPLVGYGTDSLPAFFSRTSPYSVSVRLDTPQDIARAMAAKWAAGLQGGMVIANPCFCPGKAHQVRRKYAGDMANLSDFTGAGFVFCRRLFVLTGQIGIAEQQLNLGPDLHWHLTSGQPTGTFIRFNQVGPDAFEWAGQQPLDTQRTGFNNHTVVVHDSLRRWRRVGL